MKPQLHCPQSRGFALVVALSLMILLTIIAVGLLTLSSISLRASSQENAMAEARSNARLALMLAIGDLQKSLGPDRAITAPSEILATPTTSVAKPNTTGVWESWWDFNPNGAPDYGSEKTSRFRRWLVASADMAAAGSRDFVTTGWTGKSIELVGNGSLGAAATNAGKVTAGLVPVSKNGKVQGAYGWHVSDESVKARINHYRDPGQNTTLAQRRALLAGHRPDPSVMKGPDGSLLTCLPNDRNPASYTNPKSSVGKIIDLNQAELLDNARDKIKPFRNDVTPYGHCMRPQFNCTLRLWFDRGGIYVMANLRGGGEYGTEWHLNGNLTRKQNVFDDFAACARHLIERGYTCPARLAVEGRSNGRLLMGAFLTQHPDLARAVVAHVGIYDMLRFELEPNGAFNSTEFGSVKDPAQFRAMFSYSPYHQVRDGTSYPAVLLLTGEKDGRVSPANSRKMAARLQQANASANPVLVLFSSASGHGMGTALAERIAENADVLAFLFTQLGMTQQTARDFERSV